VEFRAGQARIERMAGIGIATFRSGDRWESVIRRLLRWICWHAQHLAAYPGGERSHLFQLLNRAPNWNFKRMYSDYPRPEPWDDVSRSVWADPGPTISTWRSSRISWLQGCV